MAKKPPLAMEDLFEEKSLWAVLKLFPNGFRTPLIANYLSVLSVAISAPLLVWGRYLVVRPSLEVSDSVKNYISDEHILNFVRSLAGSGLTLGVGVLSVIIAGFAIFASGSDVRILRLMIQRKRSFYTNGIEQQHKRSTLLFVYSIFMYAMVTFSLLSITCLVSLAVADANSVPYNLMTGLAPNFVTPMLIAISSLLIAQLVFTVSILKSFIWNMYQVLIQMSALRVLVEEAKVENQKIIS